MATLTAHRVAPSLPRRGGCPDPDCQAILAILAAAGLDPTWLGCWHEEAPDRRSGSPGGSRRTY
jgi:hypothetical protein